MRWTPERVYNRPDKSWLTMPPHNTTGQFTPEFLAETKRETRWIPLEQKPPFPPELETSVGMRDVPCPICDGTGRYSLLHRGELTEIEMYRDRRCYDCEFLHAFFWRWKETPARFQDVQLSTLAPYSLRAISEAEQTGIISALQDRPDESYLFIGPPGTGKTHMMIALYRQALQRSTLEQIRKNDRHQTAWHANATSLLGAHSEWAVERNKDDPDFRLEPTVTQAKIALAVKHGYRPALFIDELDKVSPTESKMSALSALVNAVYEANGQLVATMNKTPDEVSAKWGDNEAITILRRIGEGQEASTIMFG